MKATFVFYVTVIAAGLVYFAVLAVLGR